jgi:hypothetical protein
MSINSTQRKWFIVLGNLVPLAIVYIPQIIASSQRPANAPEDWSGLGGIAIIFLYAVASFVALFIMLIGSLFHKKIDFLLAVTTVVILIYSYFGLLVLWQKSLE